MIMQIWANYMTGAFLHLSCDRRHFAFLFLVILGSSLSLFLTVDGKGWVLGWSDLILEVI